MIGLPFGWGIFGGLDYYTTTKYDVGTKTEVVSSATPTTTSVSETGLGSVKVSRDPVFHLGPVVDAFFSIRWFPQLMVGFQGGILYSTEAVTTTHRTTRTRSYDIVNGAAQSATADSSSDNKVVSRDGSSMGTLAVGGTTFSLMGNFSLRYIW